MQGELLAQAAAQAVEQVLDVACGTGVLSLAMASIEGQAGSVMGVDVSAGRVASAEKRPCADSVSAPRQPAQPHLQVGRWRWPGHASMKRRAPECAHATLPPLPCGVTARATVCPRSWFSFRRGGLGSPLLASIPYSIADP